MVDANQLQNLCPICQAPLLARYDLARVQQMTTPAAIADRPPSIWRWRELLPVCDPQFMLSLGEGETPLVQRNSPGRAAWPG